MSKPPEPRISVIIPCYNQGRFLGEALDSVVGQTYASVEAIVVDDGSTDNTAEVAARYRDRVRYVRKENAGLPAARNTGILAAEGEFVLFLDSDDFLRLNLLERYMEAICVYPTTAVFYGSHEDVDVEGRVIRRHTAQPLEADPFHTLLTGNRFPPNALLVRRTAFANAGLFDVALRSCEDWDMWIRLAASGCRFEAVPDAVAAYRNYPGSMSRNADRMWLTGLAVLRKHQDWHRNCGDCRRSIRQGRHHMRSYTLDILLDELEHCRSRAEYLATTRKIARLVWKTPPVLRLLSRELRWCLLRQTAPLRSRLMLERPEGS
jgi:glycosyltransferase involved in cell wall biosynthesis